MRHLSKGYHPALCTPNQKISRLCRCHGHHLLESAHISRTKIDVVPYRASQLVPVLHLSHAEMACFDARVVISCISTRHVPYGSYMISDTRSRFFASTCASRFDLRARSRNAVHTGFLQLGKPLCCITINRNTRHHRTATNCIHTLTRLEPTRHLIYGKRSTKPSQPTHIIR